MMAIAIIAVYTHQVWLVPVAMLVAVSAILGVPNRNACR